MHCKSKGDCHFLIRKDFSFLLFHFIRESNPWFAILSFPYKLKTLVGFGDIDIFFLSHVSSFLLFCCKENISPCLHIFILGRNLLLTVVVHNHHLKYQADRGPLRKADQFSYYIMPQAQGIVQLSTFKEKKRRVCIATSTSFPASSIELATLKSSESQSL